MAQAMSRSIKPYKRYAEGCFVALLRIGLVAGVVSKPVNIASISSAGTWEGMQQRSSTKQRPNSSFVTDCEIVVSRGETTKILSPVGAEKTAHLQAPG